jgi:tRNA dimethylallyltransferase
VSPQAPLVIVAGSTGSGKSDLALSLAETFHGEIVNCDSLQLYRYLNVGTAKTPESERRGIPHHLLDVINPDEVFTAGGYARIARKVIAEISERGKLPIVVGGTGFYLRALLEGLFQGPERNTDLRIRLARRPESLHKLLNRFDPAAAVRIHQNDTQKLIRALEVCLQTRQPITSLHAQGRDALEGFRPIKLGLDPPRLELVDRLNLRCARMFESGLMEEVREVIARGYPPSSKAFESIGYREAILHLNGSLTFEQAIIDTQTATRQYAKRQRTWFRREPGIVWLPNFGNLPQTLETAISHIQNHLNIF